MRLFAFTVDYNIIFILHCISSFICSIENIFFLLFQLPVKSGHQTAQTMQNIELIKQCLIHVSKYKFSTVILELTKILQSVDQMVCIKYVTISYQWHLSERESSFTASLWHWRRAELLWFTVHCSGYPRKMPKYGEEMLLLNALTNVWLLKVFVWIILLLLSFVEPLQSYIEGSFLLLHSTLAKKHQTNLFGMCALNFRLEMSTACKSLTCCSVPLRVLNREMASVAELCEA